jgi:hypothetical protein
MKSKLAQRRLVLGGGWTSASSSERRVALCEGQAKRRCCCVHVAHDLAERLDRVRTRVVTSVAHQLQRENVGGDAKRALSG